MQAGTSARILLIGQAPGRNVHETGVPWQDPSGDRLRAWMGIDAATFYSADHIALVPMGFCYPGRGRSGDLPPRPECAPLWHHQILELLTSVQLTLLVGRHAQARYLPGPVATLTETVRNWELHLPAFVLPHPSPRNRPWLRKYPWFEGEVVPALQRHVAAALE